MKLSNIKTFIESLINPWKQIRLFIFFLGLVLLTASTIIGLHKVKLFLEDPINQGEVITSISVSLPKAKADTQPLYYADMPVENKIIFYADMFGVDKDTALRIAKCESGLNPKAENVNGSATGLFQFIRKTWKNECGGDVYNEDHNIICFMQEYPKHFDWWECK